MRTTNSDLIALLMLVATVSVLGSGILYLSGRVQALPQSNTLFSNPPDSPLRIG
jgi:hypothetical protein